MSAIGRIKNETRLNARYRRGCDTFNLSLKKKDDSALAVVLMCDCYFRLCLRYCKGERPVSFLNCVLI